MTVFHGVGLDHCKRTIAHVFFFLGRKDKEGWLTAGRLATY
jgi:hypothetical protein